MTREEAKKWLKSLHIKDFGWDDYAMQESQKEIRERCENAFREALEMAIEALSEPRKCGTCEWYKACEVFDPHNGTYRRTEPKIVGVKFSPFTIEDTSTPSQTSVRGTQEVEIIEMPSVEPIGTLDYTLEAEMVRWLKESSPSGDLISKKLIQEALIEKISRLNAEGEKSIKTATEFCRFKRYIDGMTPVVVAEPSGDLISREDVFGCIEDAQDGSVETYNTLSKVFNDVLALTSADRPQGKWVDFVSKEEGRFKECNQCGEGLYLSTFYENDYNYCPNCGARMTERSDSRESFRK